MKARNKNPLPPQPQIEVHDNQAYELVPLKQTRDYWHMLGPGLTTGASDDDPSGIATYSQAGAAFGFNLLWTSLFSFPLMAVVTEMCARIGVVTGRGLAGTIRRHYSKKIIYTIAGLLFIANTFNIGADLAAMGDVGKLLVPAVPAFLFTLLLAILTLLLEILTTYKQYAKYMKWLALILLTYVLSAFSVHVNWTEALKHTFVPTFTFSKRELFLFVAIVGTTVSPYLFFWQTSQEVEEQILEGKKTIKARAAVTTPEDIRAMRVDVWSGMFVSNIVMFFIIAASAATLNAHGITFIATAAQAAEALRPFAGNVTYLLFALGIIGTGLLAIPVLAGSSSYAISESFGWREGLYRKFRQAYAFYGVISISILLGLAINLFHIDPIRALIYSAVINAIIAPFILVLVLLTASNRKIMGEWANKPFVNYVGWFVILFMSFVGIIGAISFFY